MLIMGNEGGDSNPRAGSNKARVSFCSWGHWSPLYRNVENSSFPGERTQAILFGIVGMALAWPGTEPRKFLSVPQFFLNSLVPRNLELQQQKSDLRQLIVLKWY